MRSAVGWCLADFGSYYRAIQQQLIDMENCFELLATNPSLMVCCAPASLLMHAIPCSICTGHQLLCSMGVSSQ